MENEVAVIENAVLSLPDQARAISVILDDDQYARAGEVLLRIKALRKQVNEAFDPIIKKTDEAHSEAIARKRKVEAPLVEAEGHLKPRIGVYIEEKERQRREEERALQEKAQKEAEDQQVREAEDLERMGDKVGAQAVIAVPVRAAPVVVPKSIPKLQGVSTKVVWKFRISNQDNLPRDYMTPDLVKIGAVVRALKGAAQIPGVEAYSEQVIAAG